MLNKVIFRKDFRCFKAGEILAFRPGVNLIVGEQGCGKSSLLFALRNKNSTMEKITNNIIIDVDTGGVYHKTMIFDFEKDSPRVKELPKKDKLFMPCFVHKFFASHGQTVNKIIQSIEDVSNHLIFMDEPDMALSIRSCNKLVKTMKSAAEKGNQILAAVHNPIVISSFDEVFNMECRQWEPSKNFIEKMMKE